MIATSTGSVTYAELWDRARELLAPLGMTESEVPPTFAPKLEFEAGYRIRCAAWDVGPCESRLADCRAVTLSGPAADVFVAVIFPHFPKRLPVFVAELYALSQRPALAYLDLPSPGLNHQIRNEVADQTTVLSIRHAPFLPRNETPPPWVVDDSPGGYLFTQTTDEDAVVRLSQAFDDYLKVWIDFAYKFAERTDFGQAGDFPLARFKRRCIHQTFSQTMLARQFGTELANRVVAEFLYR